LERAIGAIMYKIQLKTIKDNQLKYIDIKGKDKEKVLKALKKHNVLYIVSFSSNLSRSEVYTAVGIEESEKK
jgi:predicted glycosyltransferase involved in capsule biosynthesis